MNFGWGPDSYAVPYGNPDVKTAYLSTPLGASNGNPRYVLQSSVAMMSSRLRTINSSSFADVMSAFTIQDPAGYKLDLGSTTVDPMNMSLETYQSTAPSTASRHDSAQASSATGKITPTEETSQTPDDDLDEEEPPQLESETTHQARYAANQRHAKARNFQKANINTINSNSHTTLATTQATEKKKKNPARKEQSRSCQMPTTPTQANREHPSQRRTAERDECAAEVLRSEVARGAQRTASRVAGTWRVR
jgi:hypothetical protein